MKRNNEMLCLTCNKNEAQRHPQYGVLPCTVCQKRKKQIAKFGVSVEFTTSEIKDQRKAYKGDIVQPFRHGQLSKEYVDKWGTSHLSVTKEEVAKAKNVWSGDTDYYKE